MKLEREMTPGLVAPAGASRAPRWTEDAAPVPAPSPWARVPGALFIALLVLGVLPIWLVAHVPTQDGGNHVESVIGLLRLPHSALLQHHYLPNYGLQPNWLTQIVLAGLVQITSPRIAEKLILSGYLVLLPLAFRAALPRTARGRWAALAIFPFVHSYPFHMGFWNFSYSVVLFFVALGYWYRTRGRLDRRRGLVFTAITTFLFVAHSVSTVAALAAMTSILAWRGVLVLLRTGPRARRRRVMLRGLVRRAIATYAYALPALALLVTFFFRQPRPLAYRPPLLDYVKHFAGLYALVSFDRWELIITCTVSVLVGATVVLSLWKRTSRRLRPVDGWLAAGVVAAVLYFMTPDSVAAGAQLNDRLQLYPFFVALLWLGFSRVPLSRVRALAVALTVVFVAGSALRLHKYRQIDAYLADYESVAPHIAEDSTILPLTFAPFGPRQGGLVDGKKLLSYRVQVFQHVNGYVAAARNGIDLDNSQANTTHTPLHWKDELNPFTYMNTRPYGMEDEPPCVELWTYTALCGRIDYVIVWGATPAAQQDECGSAVLAELASGYERVYVSPRGMLQLYRPVRGPASR